MPGATERSNGRRFAAGRAACAIAWVALVACPAGAAEEDLLAKLDAEIRGVAALHDGSASPENLARAARLRQALGAVVAIAVPLKTGSDGAAHDEGDEVAARSAERAWGILEEALAHRNRNVAMEAALAILAANRDEALARLFRCYPRMDVAVRRQTTEMMRAGGRDVRPVTGEVLEALSAERDRETTAALVRLAGTIGTARACKAICEASPPPPPGRRSGARDAPEDPAASLREAIVETLSAWKEAEGTGWLAGDALVGTGEGAEARLWVAARVAGEARAEKARGKLEDLAAGAPPVSEAALEAIRRLGPGPSAERLKAIASGEKTHPRTAAMAAVIVADIDEEAALDLLLALTRKEGWEHRAEALSPLGRYPASDAAFRRTLDLLDDPNREVRTAAYETLRTFRRKESVPLVIRKLAPLRIRDAAAAQGFLEWASGRKLGRDFAAWNRWWEAEGGKFEFPKEGSGPGPLPAPAPGR